ncbi:MAG: hypothetical protein NE330_18920 [Lentisphaeraceae bacterium]|nr:hypothetical protein [Lentisphaeraceae bacterium]
MEVVAVIAAIGSMLLVGKLIFTDLSDFGDAVAYWFKPDIFSWFQGEGMEDFFAELKLGFLALCGFGTYWAITTLTTQ